MVMRVFFRTAFMLATLLGPMAALAQTPGSAARPWAPPRHADGQPDIQGLWQTLGGGMTVTLEKGSVDLLESDRVGFQDALKSLAKPIPVGIVDPPDGKIPLQPWAEARRKEIAANYRDPKGNVAYMDPSARCLGAGVPRINYVTPYNGYQFIQTPGYVVLYAEWNHEARIVPVDGRPHLRGTLRQWMGDSRGRWEGNTLIVETTHLVEQVDQRYAHSDKAKIVERYRLEKGPKGQTVLVAEMTMTDPGFYTAPVTMVKKWEKVPNGHLLPYECAEENWIKHLEQLEKKAGK
jgi:hypothetical protein